MKRLGIIALESACPSLQRGINAQTWQAGAALHSVGVLPIAQAADVEAQRLDVIDTTCHHQVLVHQVATVRARLGQEGEKETMK